jgi:hypothetical protein
MQVSPVTKSCPSKILCSTLFAAVYKGAPEGGRGGFCFLSWAFAFGFLLLLLAFALGPFALGICILLLAL